MAGGVAALLKKVAGGQKIGLAGQVLGGVANTIGAAKQIKVAKNQIREGRNFNSQQQRQFGSLYDDLIAKAQGQETYKADTSAYSKVVSEAERQKREASTSINPADAMMREDARQSTSNFIGAASRGARSATDLLSIAGAAYGNEKGAIRDINRQNAQESFARREQSSNNLLNSLSELAGATARERGLEFQSNWTKGQGLIDLTRDKGLGGLEMAYQGQQEDFARRAALVDAQSSMWNGIGDVFRGVGQGYMNYQLANNQMDILRSRASATGQNSDMSWIEQFNKTQQQLQQNPLPNDWKNSRPVYRGVGVNIGVGKPK